MTSTTTKTGRWRKAGKAALTFLLMSLLMALLVVTFLTFVDKVFGDLEQFSEWQRTHYEYMLAWRLLVYATLAFGWLKIRKQLVQQASSDIPAGLMRCEVIALLLIALMELRRAGLLEGVSTL
ncbi:MULTISPECIES: hypothetical protein [Pseudomonas syringae group]|uniref:Uncharacterized protein n=2 Tax=Pseudomonas syringae group TaxID=136849 RepID=A0A0P9N5P4_PSESX|nr:MULTISPECIES: hypothetical protein [Pseudomonas syringae group]KPX00301.1 Uncharacterized protein ALO50_03378 [Pseudomonas syringae pv. cerasicola]KWS95915.1 hypothetical protein AL049_02020 [Pseudomonas syringae pv. cerasicola]PHN68885.1 hypothetical protein AO252_00740 [Pseudomonas syringae pv. cerasicola]PHN69918.1 hypothetical protein AO272_16400 [Pseudomonas syringae pv. cerasicola]RMS73191.1 hypothetical protein ALP61_02505 [Pseudomonas savastanoi]